MRRGASFVGCDAIWSVACWTICIIGEGGTRTSQDELLGLGIAEDNRIVVPTMFINIST